MFLVRLEDKSQQVKIVSLSILPWNYRILCFDEDFLRMSFDEYDATPIRKKLVYNCSSLFYFFKAIFRYFKIA